VNQVSETNILLEKIREQADISQGLIALIPTDALEWSPQIIALEHPREGALSEPPGYEIDSSKMVPNNSNLLPIGYLLGHLLDCMAGFCAVLYAANTTQLAYFVGLRKLEVNHFCGVQEALARMRDYMEHIEAGFSLLEDADLTKALPTVFVARGEPILTLILGNLEHLINHKYQLFLYLRLLGLPVGTEDLYRSRGGR
jgi:hypothetical protein